MRFYLKISVCIAVLAIYALGLCLYPFSVFTFILGIFVCNWLVNLCHELGHLAAYRLLGLEWKRMVISWFVFESGKGLRIDMQGKLYAASCTCVYHSHKAYWRYCAALLSGGALCLLLSSAAILCGCFLTGGAKAFLLCFGIVCALNALANLLLPVSPDRALLKQIRQEKRENPSS